VSYFALPTLLTQQIFRSQAINYLNYKQNCTPHWGRAQGNAYEVDYHTRIPQCGAQFCLKLKLIACILERSEQEISWLIAKPAYLPVLARARPDGTNSFLRAYTGIYWFSKLAK
jgi:hypothetical protein